MDELNATKKLSLIKQGLTPRILEWAYQNRKLGNLAIHFHVSKSFLLEIYNEWVEE